MRIIETFGDYTTVTSAIRIISESNDLPEATARWNFNSLVKRGVIDRDEISLTPLGNLILDMMRGECVHHLVRKA